jgi:hypothetical protein
MNLIFKVVRVRGSKIEQYGAMVDLTLDQAIILADALLKEHNYYAVLVQRDKISGGRTEYINCRQGPEVEQVDIYITVPEEANLPGVDVAPGCPKKIRTTKRKESPP